MPMNYMGTKHALKGLRGKGMDMELTAVAPKRRKTGQGVDKKRLGKFYEMYKYSAGMAQYATPEDFIHSKDARKAMKHFEAGAEDQEAFSATFGK